jgi:hypothetical protein
MAGKASAEPWKLGRAALYGLGAFVVVEIVGWAKNGLVLGIGPLTNADAVAEAIGYIIGEVALLPLVFVLVALFRNALFVKN